MEARANDQSMRAFIEMVERRYPEDIIRIKEKVSRDIEMTSTVFEFESAGGNPC
jgi:2,5-furandicarboxylate decarboxylase 1